MIAAELSASNLLIGQGGPALDSHWSQATLSTWALSTNGPTSCHPCLMSAATINFLFIPPTKGHVSTLMILNVPNILGHCRVF